MLTKVITISLPSDLATIMDEAAKADYSSRSNYIRKAVVEKLHADQARKDEWQKILDQYAPQSMDLEQVEKDDEFFKAAGYGSAEEFVKYIDQPRY